MKSIPVKYISDFMTNQSLVKMIQNLSNLNELVSKVIDQNSISEETLDSIDESISVFDAPGVVARAYELDDEVQSTQESQLEQAILLGDKIQELEKKISDIELQINGSSQEDGLAKRSSDINDFLQELQSRYDGGFTLQPYDYTPPQDTTGTSTSPEPSGELIFENSPIKNSYILLRDNYGSSYLSSTQDSNTKNRACLFNMSILKATLTYMCGAQSSSNIFMSDKPKSRENYFKLINNSTNCSVVIQDTKSGSMGVSLNSAIKKFNDSQSNTFVYVFQGTYSSLKSSFNAANDTELISKITTSINSIKRDSNIFLIFDCQKKIELNSYEIVDKHVLVWSASGTNIVTGLTTSTGGTLCVKLLSVLKGTGYKTDKLTYLNVANGLKSKIGGFYSHNINAFNESKVIFS